MSKKKKRDEPEDAGDVGELSDAGELEEAQLPANPAEHVDLFPAGPDDVQPSSPDALQTAVSAVGRTELPRHLAEAMTSAEELEISVDHSRFRSNRPQAGFIRLPWPLATRDPEIEGQAIWWYAAAIADVDGRSSIYLEGMRGPNVRALAQLLWFKNRRTQKASDLVEQLPENTPHAAVDRSEGKGARGAGARQASSSERALAQVVPDDCEIVFRQMVDGEAVGSWRFRDLAKFIILSQWGHNTHPDMLKLRQQAAGWVEQEPTQLYPSGGGLY